MLGECFRNVESTRHVVIETSCQECKMADFHRNQMLVVYSKSLDITAYVVTEISELDVKINKREINLQKE